MFPQALQISSLNVEEFESRLDLIVPRLLQIGPDLVPQDLNQNPIKKPECNITNLWIFQGLWLLWKGVQVYFGLYSFLTLVVLYIIC